MSTIKRRGPWYWERYVGDDGAWRQGPPPGEELAALRAGLGRQAGVVPALWPYYQAVTDDRLARQGRVSNGQQAEHAALALYGLHQQSQREPMHRPGVPVGKALRRLHGNGKYSQEAVDARVNAAAACTSTNALLVHLRGLVSQLRSVNEPVDYTALLRDIDDWCWPESRQRVRRRWGNDYYGWSREETERSSGQDMEPSLPPHAG